MIASLFDIEGQEEQTGSYCHITTSLYKAAIDAMSMFNGDEFTIATHFAVVKVDNTRLVIGKVK